MNFTQSAGQSIEFSSTPVSPFPTEIYTNTTMTQSPRPLEGSSNCPDDPDKPGYVDDCASISGGLAAANALPTPPPSLVPSAKDNGGVDNAVSPFIPGTRGADPLVASPKTVGERPAWRTRTGLSPKDINQLQKRDQTRYSPTSTVTTRRTNSGRLSRPRRRTLPLATSSHTPDVMEFSPISGPYHRSPSAMDGDELESLSELSSVRPTARGLLLRSLPDPPPDNVLGLELEASHIESDLPSSPNGGLGLYSPPPPSSRPRRLNRLLCPLQILVPEPMYTEVAETPTRPVTSLYYPRTDAGELCTSPETQSSSFPASRLPEASYHIAVGASPFVHLAAGGEPALDGQAVTYSPHSPPPLAHPAYISLPPESSASDHSRRSSPIEASFRMLQLHDESGTGLHVVRGRAEEMHNGEAQLIANLPHEETAELLSPLELTSSPSLRLEDLEERISHCLAAMDWITLSLASSPFISRSEVRSLTATLISSLSGIRETSLQPAPDLELLAEAHGPEWRGKYEAVVASLGRNVSLFLLVSDQIGRRPPRAHQVMGILDKLSWYSRKFEDLDHRLQVFHDHIQMLELRAELRRLSVAAQEEATAERHRREELKGIAEESRRQRRELRGQIRREKEAARMRWARGSRTHDA